MKARAAIARVRHAPELQSNFIRGFVSAGLLASFQRDGRRAHPNTRRILRLALQGGAALSAGGATVEALRRDSPLGALGAIATGAAAVMMIEHLLQDEKPNPEEP